MESFISSSLEIDEEPDTDILLVEISGITLSVLVASDDFNEGKKTLFATMIWNGSKVLASYLLGEGRPFVAQKRVIEFGAGAGVPSLISLRGGASFVCCSDYPAQKVLATLNKNITLNVEPSSAGKIKVVGHIWGEDVTSLLQAIGGDQYDVALAAECLWKHDSHTDFLRSLAASIKPEGFLIVTFSHHIPGLEADDLSFFDKAASFGFRPISAQSFPTKHMWSDKTVDMYLHILQLCPN